MKNVQLLIVDPQNDFCVADSMAKLRQEMCAKGMPEDEVNNILEPHTQSGTLVVPGAEGDMIRLAGMIDRIGSKLDDIHITMDSHQTIGIERPGWWKNAKDGTPVAPFTALGLDGNDRIVQLRLENGSLVPTDIEVTTCRPSKYQYSQEYLKALANNNRYPHVVWTKHCCVGTWGWGVVPELSEAVSRWEAEQFAKASYVVKGNNPQTEHFSAVKAEVPDPGDNGTQVNTGSLITPLEKADIILIAGEALSHCVANTVRDTVTEFSDPSYVEKMVLLTDASSNVGGFEFLGDAFLEEMTKKGMKLSTTEDFLM